MTDALNAAPAKAVDAEQSVRIQDHFTDREQYLINIFLDQTVVLVKADPDGLADTLRAEHRITTIGDDHGDAEAIPARRRLHKGRKGAVAAVAEPVDEGNTAVAGEGKRARRGRAGGKAGPGKAAAGNAGVGRAGARRAGGGKRAGGRGGRARAAKPDLPTED